MTTAQWREQHKIKKTKALEPRDKAYLARHLSKYFFPRQYGLENVFEVPVDMQNSRYEQFERAKYANREQEIAVRIPYALNI